MPLPRTLVSAARVQLPPLSAARDARDNPLIYNLGLAGAWNFLGTRFTTEGRGLLLATGAWFLWGVNALELQAHVPLLYAGCVWLLALLALRMAKPCLRLEARHPERIAAGQSCPVTLEAEAPRSLNTRIIPRALPAGLDYEPAEGALLSPAGNNSDGSSWRASLSLQARRRGVSTLRGWRAHSDYPFGILRNWQDNKTESRLTVVPAFTPLTSLQLGAGRAGQGGCENLRHQGEQDEFSGNRPFREGDAVRHVDWRSTARLQSLVVREWNSQPLLRAAVVLDTRAGDAEDELFERSVSLCAAVADYLARIGYTVALFAAGETVHFLQTGPQQAYLDEILDLLASVQRSAPRADTTTAVPGFLRFFRGSSITTASSFEPPSALEAVAPHTEGMDTVIFITLHPGTLLYGAADACAAEQLLAGGALRTLVVCSSAPGEGVASHGDPTAAVPGCSYVTPAAQESGAL